VNHIAFENNQPVETTEFDHSSIDSPGDIMRERLEMRTASFEIVQELALEAAKELAMEKVRAFIALIAVEKRPLYFIDQLVWLSGLARNNGLSLPALAKKHGVSKQAFEQAAERTNAHFHFPKTSAQRSDEARENMREAYRERV
jgi:hypothetical protein